MTSLLKIQSKNSVVSFHPDKGVLERWTVASNSGSREIFHPPTYVHPSIPNWPAGGCPILFPWAGRCWSADQLGGFEFHGRRGTVPVHGDAYLRSVEVDAHQSNMIRFHASSKYRSLPWKFECLTTYEISEGELSMRLDVQNRDSIPMPIAPGIHPFFALGDLSEWGVDIPATKAFAVTDRGLAGEARCIDIAARSAIDPELKSLILGDLKSETATLAHMKSGQKISVHWFNTESQNIVLWADAAEGYFCLEPWAGLPDAVHNGHGLHVIPPGGSQSFHYRITLD